MTRSYGRGLQDTRPIEILPNYQSAPDGSALIRWGETVVLCSAFLEERVPPFLEGTGRGWLTAEYSMLPSATRPRGNREWSRGRPSGRTMEIQRIIGRTLRSAVNFDVLGQRTFYIDCDVIQADGGTRCAAITGGWVALAIASEKLVNQNVLVESPIQAQVCAVSAGIMGQEIIVDLDYEEDSKVDVDVNLGIVRPDKFVEIQATGEHGLLSLTQLNRLCEAAVSAAQILFQLQETALNSIGVCQA